MEPSKESGNVGGEMKGNASQFKGKLKQKWSDLTDADLDPVIDRKDRLAGVIATKVGEDKSAIDREIDRLSRESNYSFQR
ncbi:MAG TPA: CsbD family protein [Candidatus Thermoplasmatota archaeon]|nr:CsbD family protein [Candidatus Thermoplasmatota archaeon]